MKRIHVLDSKTIDVDTADELVVAIGPAAEALRAKGVPVVEAESPLTAALYVQGELPAVLRLSVADPLGFFALLVARDGSQERLVA